VNSEVNGVSEPGTLAVLGLGLLGLGWTGREYFDARVTVLSDMIKHHVKEEEQRGGLFTKAPGLVPRRQS